MRPLILNTLKDLILSPENKSSALYYMNLYTFSQYHSSLNSTFSVPYLAISYDTIHIKIWQFLAPKVPSNMLTNNTKIVVETWYQMIQNDESNNFLFETYFPDH